MFKNEGMEKGLNYINIAMEDWLIALLNSATADLYLLYDAKNFPVDGPFSIDVSDNYWRESAPLEKRQGYLILKDKSEKNWIEEEWLKIFNKQVASKKYTIAGLVNFLILTDRIGSLTDNNLYELTLTLCDAIPVKQRQPVLEILIKLFNQHYKFGRNTKPVQYDNTADWIKLFHTVQYIDRINNPIHLLIRLFKKFSSQIDVLETLSKLSPEPRVALVEYGIDFINFMGAKLTRFLKVNQKEVPFYAALIADRAKEKPVFFNKQLAELIIHEYWNIAGNYFFQVIFNSTKKLHEDVESTIKVEITKLLRGEIYTNQADIRVIKQFNWPEDYVALGGWLQQKKQTNKDGDLNTYLLNFLTDELASQFKHIKNGIPEMLSTRNSSSKEKWLGDPFKINNQYLQVYLNWSMMNADDGNWSVLKTNYKALCQELKVLLYASYTGKHIGLKLANQLLVLLLNFPLIELEEIPGLHRLQELHSIFIKYIGLQWIFFNEQNRLIWNNKEHQPGFMDAELLFIINNLKSCPQPYQSTVSPLIALIKQHQMTEWPIGT